MYKNIQFVQLCAIQIENLLTYFLPYLFTNIPLIWAQHTVIICLCQEACSVNVSILS